MRISHEAIYQALYVQAGVHSNASWWRFANRASVAGPENPEAGQEVVSPEIMISQRPAEADDRAVPDTGRRPDPRTAEFRRDPC